MKSQVLNGQSHWVKSALNTSWLDINEKLQTEMDELLQQDHSKGGSCFMCHVTGGFVFVSAKSSDVCVGKYGFCDFTLLLFPQSHSQKRSGRCPLACPPRWVLTSRNAAALKPHFSRLHGSLYFHVLRPCRIPFGILSRCLARWAGE